MDAHNAITTEGQTEPDEGVTERRSGERHISVLINAGIRKGEEDAMCRIRNLSPGGVMIEAPLTLEVDDAIELHLRSGHKITGSVRWSRDGRSGVAFDQPGSAELVNAPPPVKRVSIRRQPEEHNSGSPIGYPLFRRKGWAQIATGTMNVQAPVLMISPTGVLVENIHEWGSEKLFSVDIDGLGRHQARLGQRLVVDDTDGIGLVFVDPLHYRTLNDWLLMTPRRIQTVAMAMAASSPRPEMR